MPVGRAIITLAIPTVIANIIQYVYNLTDTYFIGKLNNANMIAAIGLCMPIVMVLQSFGNMFAVGGASIISRMLGAGRREDAKRVAATAFWTAFSISAVIALTASFFTRPLTLLCGASENTVGYASQYLIFLLIGAPFMSMQMALNGILRSEGATNISMRGMVIGSVVNMILDPFFIFPSFLGLPGFGLNIIGAAIATTIGNLCGFLVNLSHFTRGKAVLSVSPKMVRIKWEYYADILKIGVPASFGMMLMSFAQILSNKVAVTFGDNLIASNNVVMRVSNIAMMFTMGLTMGCQPLLGYNYGAKRYRRLNSAIRFTMSAGTMLNLCFAVIMWTHSRFWISVFINVPEVVDLGSKIIRCMCFSMPFMAIQMTLMTCYQALGKPIAALIVSLGRQGLFFVPAIYIFSYFWGLEGFIWASPMANIFTAVVSVIIFMFVRRDFPSSADESLQPASAVQNGPPPVMAMNENPAPEGGPDL